MCRNKKKYILVTSETAEKFVQKEKWKIENKSLKKDM